MKHKLLGIIIGALFATPFATPVFAATTPTSASTANVSSAGGAGGTGGQASGGAATGGTATNSITGTTATGNSSTLSTTNAISGLSASGNSSNVSVSVTMPDSAATNASTTPTATNASAGVPGSSAYNTMATVDNTGTSTIKTTPPVAAPALTTTLSDTCMGSVSFGLSFTGFGASGGSTIVDQACVRRLDAREFRSMGMNDVALALLCQSDANKKAVESAGHTCPGSEKPVVVSDAKVLSREPAPKVVQSEVVSEKVSPPSPVSSVPESDGSQYSDPVIRMRLGLDPLPEDAAVK